MSNWSLDDFKTIIKKARNKGQVKGGGELRYLSQTNLISSSKDYLLFPIRFHNFYFFGCITLQYPLETHLQFCAFCFNNCFCRFTKFYLIACSPSNVCSRNCERLVIPVGDEQGAWGPIICFIYPKLGNIHFAEVIVTLKQLFLLYINSFFPQLPGVDPNDPSLKDFLASLQGQSEVCFGLKLQNLLLFTSILIIVLFLLNTPFF